MIGQCIALVCAKLMIQHIVIIKCQSAPCRACWLSRYVFLWSSVSPTNCRPQHHNQMLEERQVNQFHFTDVTMSPMASQITNLRIVYSTVYSGVNQRKHQSFVWRIHRGPVNSQHKRSVTRKMFSFDDVIMWPPSTPVPNMGSTQYQQQGTDPVQHFPHRGYIEMHIVEMNVFC